MAERELKRRRQPSAPKNRWSTTPRRPLSAREDQGGPRRSARRDRRGLGGQRREFVRNYVQKGGQYSTWRSHSFPSQTTGPDFASLLARTNTAAVPTMRETELTIRHSTTVVALRFADGVVMAGDRRATEGHSNAPRRIRSRGVPPTQSLRQKSLFTNPTAYCATYPGAAAVSSTGGNTPWRACGRPRLPDLRRRCGFLRYEDSVAAHQIVINASEIPMPRKMHCWQQSLC